MKKETMVEELEVERDSDLNRDPITGAPGSHPVGTTMGGLGGAAAGAVAGGAIGGPVGAAVGGVVGAVAGAAAGHGIAEGVNPTVEDAYWREHYSTRGYAKPGQPYNTYQPAYRYGWEARQRYPKRSFEDVENDLERGWERAKGTSHMAWTEARLAARDAWHRVERALPGDFDRDGR